MSYKLIFTSSGHTVSPNSMLSIRNGVSRVHHSPELKKGEIGAYIHSFFTQGADKSEGGTSLDSLKLMSCDALLDMFLKSMELVGINKKNLDFYTIIKEFKRTIKDNNCYENLKNAQWRLKTLKNEFMQTTKEMNECAENKDDLVPGQFKILKKEYKDYKNKYMYEAAKQDALVVGNYDIIENIKTKLITWAWGSKIDFEMGGA